MHHAVILANRERQQRAILVDFRRHLEHSVRSAQGLGVVIDPWATILNIARRFPAVSVKALDPRDPADASTVAYVSGSDAVFQIRWGDGAVIVDALELPESVS